MENKLTIEKVIDCIGFPKDTYDHATLKTYCTSIYDLNIKRGESEEDAAMTALLRLTDSLIQYITIFREEERLSLIPTLKIRIVNYNWQKLLTTLKKYGRMEHVYIIEDLLKSSKDTKPVVKKQKTISTGIITFLMKICVCIAIFNVVTNIHSKFIVIDWISFLGFGIVIGIVYSTIDKYFTN